MTSSWAIQQPLCRPCLFSTEAKNTAHHCSREHFTCLTQGDCHKEVLFISIIKEHCIPTKTYLSFFPQFQHHPKFTSQVMVKTEVFSLAGQPFIYLIVAVCTLLASRAECACQEHCSLLPLDTEFNGLHPDKASTAT